MEPHERTEKCKEVFSLLSESLNLELPPDACQKIETHLARRPPCSEFAESLRKTVELLPPLPAGRTAGILGEQRARAAPRSLRKDARRSEKRFFLKNDRPCISTFGCKVARNAKEKQCHRGPSSTCVSSSASRMPGSSWIAVKSLVAEYPGFTGRCSPAFTPLQTPASCPIAPVFARSRFGKTYR
jgi:hypothetical protein